MLVVRPVIAYLVVAAAAAEAANLRQEQRNLQTYTQSDDYYSTMLNRVNQERASYGLPALCTNKKLQDAAQRHSDDQAQNNYMDHTGTDGTNMADRITEAGYDYDSAAENIAAGQPDVESVMRTWMNSPGHRENILGDYTMFGTAYAYNPNSQYKHYWTQDFGTGETEECYGGGVAPKTLKSTNTHVSTPKSYETTEAPYADHVDETDAPCTDEPVVVDPLHNEYGSKATDAPYTDAPVHSGYGSNTEEPCTDAPVVVDPIHSGYGSQTDAPYTDAPVHTGYGSQTDAPYTDAPVHSGYGSTTEEPCTDAPVHSGYGSQTDAPYTDAPVHTGYGSQTDAPYTDAPVHSGYGSQTDAPYTDAPVHSGYGSTTEEPCTDAPVHSGYGSQTDAPYTDAPVVVDPVHNGYGSTTEEPCTDAPIVVDGPEIGFETDAPTHYGTPSTQSPDNYKPTNHDDCETGF